MLQVRFYCCSAHNRSRNKIEYDIKRGCEEFLRQHGNPTCLAGFQISEKIFYFYQRKDIVCMSLTCTFKIAWNFFLYFTRGKTSFDNGGIGTEKVAEVKKEDDDFEVYRKRMMLAYKFRPNPLVSTAFICNDKNNFYENHDSQDWH